MRVRTPFRNAPIAAQRAVLAAALVILPVGTASKADPILWSLKKPQVKPDGLAGWRLPSPGRSTQEELPVLPDPTRETASSVSPLPQDFSIAPSVDNILNRRHDLSEDQTGMPGGSESYLRSVGRTFGLALKKALY